MELDLKTFTQLEQRLEFCCIFDRWEVSGLTLHISSLHVGKVKGLICDEVSFLFILPKNLATSKIHKLSER